jgi:nucleolar protein 58
MARMVATKAALSIRVDALSDMDEKSEVTAPSIGLENRAKLESRLRALEHGLDLGAVRTPTQNQQKFNMAGGSKVYNSAADAVDMLPTERDPMDAAVSAVLEVKKEKKEKKEKRKEKAVGQENGVADDKAKEK